MPGVTNPPYPRPHKVLFDNDAFSFISCGDEIAQGTLIYDFVDGNFQPTPTGTYPFQGGDLDVVDGVIQ